MKLNTLHFAEGSRKTRHRVGRGTGSGSGCTAGYGNNGSKARSGDKQKAYFEGGQTPLTRRIPKRGFNQAAFREPFQVVNLSSINSIESSDKEISIDWMLDKGLVWSKVLPIKILGDGEIKRAITIHAHGFSKSAKDKIEKAKGKAEVLKRA